MERRTLTMLALCAAAATAASAQTIYKWVMPDGSIRYSDRPQEEGAVKRQEIEIVTTRPEAAPPPESTPDPDGEVGADAPAAPAPDAFPGYAAFEITSPAPDQAIRDNGGNVTIQLALEPSLAEDHVIELFMNGSSVGTGRSTTITMTNVDRGTHTVQASIRDRSGARVATTGAVTFDLLRAAAGG